MFRVFFLVLLTVCLAQGYQTDDSSAEPDKSVAPVSIVRKKLNLTPTKRLGTKNANQTTNNGNNTKKAVSEDKVTHISSCKTSSGAEGNCVKEDQCATESVSLIDIRIKDDEEKPCQDPTEVCCISTETTDSLATITPPMSGGTNLKSTVDKEAPVTPGVQVTHHAEVNCGISNPNGVGTKTKGSGDVKQAKFGEFPWNVQLLDQNRNNMHVCGGAIIHPQLVVTAAHCLLGQSGGAPPRLLVRAGEWDRDSDSEELPHQDREVYANSTHGEFVQQALFNNIALLNLSAPFELTPHVGVVCLPLSKDTEAPQHYTRCLSSGWGKEASDQELQGVLKKLELPIVDELRCTKRLRKTRLGPQHVIHRSFLCAGGEGRDSCEGDGGSPLVCPMPDHPGRFMLTGIVSWTVSCRGQSIPGLYSNIHRQTKWITDESFVMSIDLTEHQFA